MCVVRAWLLALVTNLPLILILLLLLFDVHVNVAADNNYERLCRNQTCGGIAIPYPFGTHSFCGLPYFQISCKEKPSLDTPGLFRPFLQLSNQIEVEVLSFSMDFIIINSAQYFSIGSIPNCSSEKSVNASYASLAISDDMPMSVASDNIFVVVGCSSSGFVNASNSLSSPNFYYGCNNGSISCGNVSVSLCYFDHCCMAFLPEGGGFKSIEMSNSNSSCSISTMFNPAASGRQSSSDQFRYGTKLSWDIPYMPFFNGQGICLIINRKAPTYECAQNSECIDHENGLGYVCTCSRSGYSGDGYRNGTGCEDIDECADGLSNCVPSPIGACENLPGSFRCSCEGTLVGDGTKNGTGCLPLRSKTNNSLLHTTIIIGAVFSITVVATSIACLLVRRIQESRAASVRKAKYCKRNGAAQLKDYISSTTQRHHAPRLFSEAELRKATRNFAEHLKLGSGGYGTVYKGILPDATIVAIKKSHYIEQKQADQFINEVIVLSHIIHPNIVQLLGCCLETPVPILVYEYVPNGTLFEHLQKEDGRFLNWESRLAIAHQSAKAFAYLHSSVSTPIFHRDIKTSNILLDDLLMPKVSDFGISRVLPIDKTHVSTAVAGTMGYMDPKYCHNLHVTDKSDVYSFGIVLLELITSLKPVEIERGETESNLGMLSVSRWRTGTFGTLIDVDLRANEHPRVMNSINRVSKLAMRCLSEDVQERPSMEEVSELLRIVACEEAMVADEE